MSGKTQSVWEGAGNSYNAVFSRMLNPTDFSSHATMAILRRVAAGTHPQKFCPVNLSNGSLCHVDLSLFEMRYN